MEQFFFVFWYIFSSIDKLAASKMMSVNFVTIESILNFLTFVFKLNECWV